MLGTMLAVALSGTTEIVSEVSSIFGPPLGESLLTSIIRLFSNAMRTDAKPYSNEVFRQIATSCVRRKDFRLFEEKFPSFEEMHYCVKFGFSNN